MDEHDLSRFCCLAPNFPPTTSEVQSDETWDFVAETERDCEADETHAADCRGPGALGADAGRADGRDGLVERPSLTLPARMAFTD